MLKQSVLLVVVLSACTGTSTYYPSGQPQYAQQTTQTTNGNTTTTSTSTYQSTPYEQPAPPPPQPVSYEPAPQPAPPVDDGPRCHPRDNDEMCIALGVLYDVGHLLERLEERSCGKAARVLNRYADENRRDIDTLLTLEHTQTRPRLRQFAERHQAEFTLVMEQALDLDARCGGDDRFDRAMHRLGFRGLMSHR